MTPPLDVGVAVCPLAIPDGKIHDSEIISCCAEEDIEIAERIEVAKIGTIGGNQFIVSATEHLGAAQSVLNALAEQPLES